MYNTSILSEPSQCKGMNVFPLCEDIGVFPLCQADKCVIDLTRSVYDWGREGGEGGGNE